MVRIALDLHMLKVRMRDVGLSMEGLARRSGLARRTIQYYLHSQRDPSLSSVNKLARALDIHPFALLVTEWEDEDQDRERRGATWIEGGVRVAGQVKLDEVYQALERTIKGEQRT